MKQAIIIPSSKFRPTKESGSMDSFRQLPYLKVNVYEGIVNKKCVQPSVHFNVNSFTHYFLNNREMRMASSTEVGSSSLFNIASSISRLKKIEKLPANWDFKGAPKLSISILSKARSILFDLIEQPSIYPTNYNTIQFEYEKGNKYLEIEISEDKISFYKDINGIEKDGSITSIEQINKLLRELNA